MSSVSRSDEYAITSNSAAVPSCAMSGTSEVHPLPVIEAMTAGKPTVAVQSPGISDTVEVGVTGLTTAGVEGLSAAMAALAADPARARAMGDAARTASERYDIERTVQLTVELYESLLATRPDLQREDAHGRWSRRTEKWAGLLDQLAQLVWPSDGDDNAPRWWPASALAARRERDES